MKIDAYIQPGKRVSNKFDKKCSIQNRVNFLKN